MAPLRAARLCAWLAVAAVVVAAAEPSIRTAPRQRVGILELVVDRSGSTAAGDLAPTRLRAVQQATLALLDRVPKRVRVGLVAFTDEPVTLARPTTDRDAVRAGLASLSSYGGTAAGDALRRALDDIQAASPAAPAAVLLLSDGANATGSDPFEAARLAAARQIPVFAVAVGTPGGVLTRRDFDGVRQQPVPPAPLLLRAIAGPTGGRALEARSTPALHAALEDLGRDLGVAGEPRDVTLLFAAAALLLLAAGGALSWRRRAAPSGTGARLPAGVRRLAPPVTLLLAAGGVAVAWAQLPPPGPPPPGPPPGGAAAAPASPSRPPPPPAFVTISAVGGRDRTMVRQAIALLRRHRELADQRRAEIGRLGYERIAELRVTVCDVCTAEPLTTTPTVGTSSGSGIICSPNINTPILRLMARRAHVRATSLAAMLVHYDQELCLIGPATDRSPFAAGLRLARKLGDGRLFDLLFAQIDTGPATDWLAVEQGVALLRRHGELGAQRWDELRRRRLNQVGPLQIQVCRGCLNDPMLLGDAATGQAAGAPVFCDIRVDLAVVEGEARGWGLPVTLVVASLLAHEQEHCIRDPDDRETPAIDAERRLARKIGGARLLEYVVSSYRRLDRTGHWKR